MRWMLITVLTFCFAYAKHEMYDGHSLFKIKINDKEQMNFLNSLEIPLGLDMFLYPSPGRDARVLVSKEQKQTLINELLNNSFEFKIETENIKQHSLFKIKINDKEQMNFLNSLEIPLGLDMFLYPSPGRDARVLVSKEQKQTLINELLNNSFEFKIETENIKQSLDLEDKLIEEAKLKNSRKSGFQGKIGFDRIYNYDEVNGYLDAIAESYPDVVTLVNAGKSVEDRDIKYLKISTTDFQDTSKPIVFIESLIHSREWITLPPTLWAIEQLVVNVTESDLIDTMDWIILPIANPDGYVETHRLDRFWRKNKAKGFVPSFCSGIDLNRNFDIMFGEHSSNFVCSEEFHGNFANSEPETQIISAIMDEYKDRIDLFIDIHSTGNYIFYGWGDGRLLPNAFSLQSVGLNMGQAMDAVKLEWNRDYVVGMSALMLYEASGLAMDYANKVGIPYSFVYELPAHKDSFGYEAFLVDPNLVEHFAMETWEGIKVGARNVRDILA